MTNETKHATPAQLAAISDAHTDAANVIVARIVAVAAPVAAGVTVKDIAADMRAAAVNGAPITPVVQTTLGFATGVLSVLDKLGVSLETAVKAHPDMLADTYRAIYRHGKTKAIKAISAAVDAGETPTAKARAAHDIASGMVSDAIAERATNKGKPRAKSDPAGSVNRWAVVAKAMASAAADVKAGKSFPESPDDIAALYDAAHALIGALDALGDAAPAPRVKGKRPVALKA